MPIAKGRLEHLQVLKLLQSVREENISQIEKLVTNGIPNLINYSGDCCVILFKFHVQIINNKQIPETLTL